MNYLIKLTSFIVLIITALVNFAALSDEYSCSSHDDKLCHRLVAYADYFGFDTLADYSHFVLEFEKLVDGRAELTMQSLHKDPEIQEILFQLSTQQALSTEWQAKLEENISHRRIALAEYLGLNVKKLDSTLEAYSKYRALQLHLEKVNLTSSSDKKPVERITVTHRWVEATGGWGSLSFHFSVSNMAMQLNIPQYTLFTVVTESKEQDFKYNNFSGIIYTSEIRDCAECSSSPSPW